jgi:hypothetical protein
MYFCRFFSEFSRLKGVSQINQYREFSLTAPARQGQLVLHSRWESVIRCFKTRAICSTRLTHSYIAAYGCIFRVSSLSLTLRTFRVPQRCILALNEFPCFVDYRTEKVSQNIISALVTLCIVVHVYSSVADPPQANQMDRFGQFRPETPSLFAESRAVGNSA